MSSRDRLHVGQGLKPPLRACKTSCRSWLPSGTARLAGVKSRDFVDGTLECRFAGGPRGGRGTLRASEIGTVVIRSGHEGTNTVQDGKQDGRQQNSALRTWPRGSMWSSTERVSHRRRRRLRFIVSLECFPSPTSARV